MGKNGLIMLGVILLLLILGGCKEKQPEQTTPETEPPTIGEEIIVPEADGENELPYVIVDGELS